MTAAATAAALVGLLATLVAVVAGCGRELVGSFRAPRDADSAESRRPG